MEQLLEFCRQSARVYQELGDDYSDSGFGTDKAAQMQDAAIRYWAKADAYREVIAEIERKPFDDEVDEALSLVDEDYCDSLERDAIDGPHFYDMEG